MRGNVNGTAVIAYDVAFKKKYGSVHIPIYGIINRTEVFSESEPSSGIEISGADWGYPMAHPSDRIPLTVNIVAGDHAQYEKSCIRNRFVTVNLMESLDLLAMQGMNTSKLALLKWFSIDPWYTRFKGSVSVEVKNYKGWNISGSGDAVIEYLDLE
jgi:hypothetical protein